MKYLFALLGLVSVAPACLSAETPNELKERVRKSLEGWLHNDERLVNFHYTVEGARRDFDSKGNVKRETSWKSLHERRGKHRIERMVERDGKPVPPEERKAAEELFRERVRETNGKNLGEIEAIEGEQRRKSRDELAWVTEMPSALNCQITGRESRGGRPTLAVACVPRPGYQPKHPRARFFAKIRARLWLDEQTSELVEADGEAFESISIGWGILGRLEKGTRVLLKRRPVGDVWLNEEQTVRFAARILMMKNVARELTRRWSDFVPSGAVGASAGGP